MSRPDPEFILAVLCDLSMALDLINHEILLMKINNYGISGIAHDWFEQYISDRQQCIKVGGQISDKVSIIIPQGSILGPLLYLSVSMT